MANKAALRVKTADGKWTTIPALVAGGGGGGTSFTTDDKTVSLSPDNVLSVMTADQAVSDDPRPITAQGVYNEFAVLNALLKTI